MPNTLTAESCTVDGCINPSRTKRERGMCDMHRTRALKGTPLHLPKKGSRSADEVLVRDAQGRKECLGCREWRDADKFQASQYTVDGLKGQCMNCSARATRFRQKGITEDQFLDLYNKQGGHCAICGRHDTEFLGTINIDHDHACCAGKVSCGACVRGLLCPPCNMGIGALGDDIDRLRRAMAYLEAGGAR